MIRMCLDWRAVTTTAALPYRIHRQFNIEVGHNALSKFVDSGGIMGLNWLLDLGHTPGLNRELTP